MTPTGGEKMLGTISMPGLLTERVNWDGREREEGGNGDKAAVIVKDGVVVVVTSSERTGGVRTWSRLCEGEGRGSDTVGCCCCCCCCWLWGLLFGW